MVLVGLTFDDGFVEQLQVARYLAKLGIRATFFVITGLREYMGHELMGPAQWRELAGLGHEVGSHTVTHIDMVKSSEDLIVRELVESKKKIEEAIGNEVVSFAYPYGPHSEKAAKLARSIYRVVRTTYIGPASRYQLFDEHGCMVAFNLRLSNIYEVLRLRKFDSVILFTHIPSLRKLEFILRALSILKPRYMTLKELMDIL